MAALYQADITRNMWVKKSSGGDFEQKNHLRNIVIYLCRFVARAQQARKLQDSLSHHCASNFHEAGNVCTFNIVGVAIRLFSVFLALFMN